MRGIEGEGERRGGEEEKKLNRANWPPKEEWIQWLIPSSSSIQLNYILNLNDNIFILYIDWKTRLNIYKT